METNRGAVQTPWRKSSYSADKSGECVEVATASAVVLIRDSKNPDGPQLAVPAPAFEAFVRNV